jgi:hypothetical protein
MQEGQDKEIGKDKDRKLSRLRGLYAQRHKLNERLVKLGKDKNKIEDEISVTNDKLIGVNKGIQYLEGRDILITSHFVERYNQRVKPATEDEIRTHILTPQLLNMIHTLGNGSYPIYNYSVIVEDFKLITITLNEDIHSKKQRIKGYKNEKNTSKTKAQTNK